MESQAAVPKQYQHYIPRFLLTNFSHPFKPSGKKGATPLASQDGPPQGKAKKKKRRGKLVVNRVDMSSETALITETPVKSILGLVNVYEHTGIPQTEQNRIEQKFKDLESDASAIFRRILLVFTANRQGMWLTRDERNLVRKFLFVMKYRGTAVYGRYFHETMATYVDDDKQLLGLYMKKRGFSRPMDVWLDNLEQFIDVRMDTEMKWLQELLERTYAPDAHWFIMHCQGFYMSICYPSDRDAEFIIPDNCYSISEGPHEVLMGSSTFGEPKYTKGTSLHEFGPISPRLLIVLRSLLFPIPEEDATDVRFKTSRELWRSLNEAQFGRLSETLLADLPVSKARNNYSELVNGVLRPVHGMTGTSNRQRHSFFFNFFPLENTHVERINGVFLDNVSCCGSLVFRSEGALRASLAWYMNDWKYFPKHVGYTLPVEGGRLKKFSALLTQLGVENLFVGDRIALVREVARYIPDGENATPSMQVYQMLEKDKVVGTIVAQRQKYLQGVIRTRDILIELFRYSQTP
ncbi:hypothetical protein E4U55_003575 [Claviceps digitariae]|nr:hypothetical protein E4U55_003575 [Claviceps digitariae]